MMTWFSRDTQSLFRQSVWKYWNARLYETSSRRAGGGGGGGGYFGDLESLKNLTFNLKWRKQFLIRVSQMQNL